MQENNQLVMERVVPANDDILTTIVGLSNKLAAVESEIEDLEVQLKNKNKEREDLATKRLPDLMASVGLTELRLADGRKVSTKPEYYAKISKINEAAAFEWLRQHNMAGGVKSSLIVDADARDRLIEAVVPFQESVSIHPATLKALVREQLEAGNEFPQELFGVHVVNQAVVK